VLNTAVAPLKQQAAAPQHHRAAAPKAHAAPRAPHARVSRANTAVQALDPNFRHLGVGISIGPFRGWKTAVVVTTDFDG
jgi:hypothetical protein